MKKMVTIFLFAGALVCGFTVYFLCCDLVEYRQAAIEKHQRIATP